jgi:hypothetical protein
MHNTNPLDAPIESAIMITKIVLTIEHKKELPLDFLKKIEGRTYGLIAGDGDVYAQLLATLTGPKAEVYDPFKLEA